MSDEEKSNGEQGDKSPYNWHRSLLEGRAGLFAVLTTVGISIGGLAEIIPMYSATVGPQMLAGVEPYTPLELAGRDIYIREGCYNCHSQMVRPFRNETLRYGEWTRAGEYAYDRPFQLGSRRIGPDLQRVGLKYPDAWHYEHMEDPRTTSPGSNMPSYPWLVKDSYDIADIEASVNAMAALGVPYTPAQLDDVPGDVRAQADRIVDSLATMDIQTEPDREIVALIAYLQQLGVAGREAIAAGEAAPTVDGAADLGGE